MDAKLTICKGNCNFLGLFYQSDTFAANFYWFITQCKFVKQRFPLAILFFTILIDLLGFGIVIPILPNYAKEIGASDLMIGMVAGIYSLMQFLFTPIWGNLSDRYGRRPIILVSIGISVIAYLFFSQANTLFLLLFSRGLAGIGSGNISAAQAYIADITPPENRAKSMGLIGAAFGLGFIFGPPIGGLVKSLYGIEWVGLLTAFLCFLNLILALVILPESLKVKDENSPIRFLPIKDYIEVFKKPEQAKIFSISFLYINAFFVFQITATLLWKEHYGMDDKQIGYLFAYMGLSTTMVQGLLIGKFNQWMSEYNLLIAGSAMMMAVLYSISFVPFEYFLPFEMLLLFLFAVANGAISPTGLSLVSKTAQPHQQGKIMGLYQSFGSLARVTGPLIGSTLYGVQYHLPYLVGGSLLIINIILAKKLSKG